MKIALTISLTIFFAVPAPAQISVTYVAKTRLYVSAYYYRRTTVFKEVVASTDLKPGANISAINSSRAQCTVGFSQTATAITASVRDYAYAYYSNTSSYGRGSSGTHQTLMTLTSPKPIKALLRVVWTTSGNNTSAIGAGSVDIGDDASYEFNGGATSRTADFPITIDSKGLKISTSSYGRAAPYGTTRTAIYSGTIALQIIPPQTALFYKHGAACGPSLNGTNGFEEFVTVTATNGVASGAGMLVLGISRTSLPLVGTNCLLLVNPLLTLPIGFDSNGKFSFSAKLPPNRPLAFPLQVGSFGTTIGTSNALTIIVP